MSALEEDASVFSLVDTEVSPCWKVSSLSGIVLGRTTRDRSVGSCDNARLAKLSVECNSRSRKNIIGDNSPSRRVNDINAITISTIGCSSLDEVYATE